MIRTHVGHGGAILRATVLSCVFAVVAVLCAAVLCAPAAAADHGDGPRTRTSIEPLKDYKEPGSTCHGGPGSPADPVPPPPVPLHVPALDPVPPAARALAAVCPAGSPFDGVPAVDLHRLQVQRT
ncbi:hypothetical protein [Streptomyces litchfieldiae]|uniref:Secreted protein n=1 Tax=Streptomyces litchfieldiae TaxID=3075543 RepID=A0ABU2MUT0_9ACTN|nr:hypothetical protein [Streptomyces sp. DSM 44938]MDT0345379.1 hypothetical protein [Streptomyces sp. DSM 44938]